MVIEWYVGDSRYLAVGCITCGPTINSEQARWVKTVNIHSWVVKPSVDKTVGYYLRRLNVAIAIDWVTRRLSLNGEIA